MDLDPRPLQLSRELAAGVTDIELIEADAFDSAAYPSELDVVLSTGFGEFLSDEELTRFYAICTPSPRRGRTGSRWISRRGTFH
jgi:hypothetical protein